MRISAIQLSNRHRKQSLVDGHIKEAKDRTSVVLSPRQSAFVPNSGALDSSIETYSSKHGKSAVTPKSSTCKVRYALGGSVFSRNLLDDALRFSQE
jgi:hypothetical protein